MRNKTSQLQLLSGSLVMHPHEWISFANMSSHPASCFCLGYPFCSIQVDSTCPRATVTNYHKLSVFKQQKGPSYGSGGSEVRNQSQRGWLQPKSPQGEADPRVPLGFLWRPATLGAPWFVDAPLQSPSPSSHGVLSVGISVCLLLQGTLVIDFRAHPSLAWPHLT